MSFISRDDMYFPKDIPNTTTTLAVSQDDMNTLIKIPVTLALSGDQIDEMYKRGPRAWCGTK
jgi:hypothetical protein